MALTELQLLLRRCLHRRTSAIEFRDLLEAYRHRQKVKSRDIVSAFVNCCLHFCVESDPLLPGYLQEILLSRCAALVDFITAFLLQWQCLGDLEQQRRQKVVSVQTRLLTELNIVLATNPDLRVDELKKSIIVTARWLSTLAKWALSDSTKDNIDAQSLVQVVGILLSSQLNYNTSSDAPDIYTAVQQAIDQCMSTFPSISMELMNKIGIMQKPPQEQSATSVAPHVMEMAALQFEEGIMQPPIVPSRSATIALIQYLLSTGSTIDDSVIYTFLNTRHSGDHAVMFNELVFASVDAMIKGSKDELYQGQCQLFILNKLPFILAYLVTSSFETFSSEQNLIAAWNHLNTVETDPATGRRFLQICAFHHLIPNETVTTLVGEDSALKGLYAKDDIVAQVTANHARGPRLIDELLRNDGNAGSICQAIYEVMNNYCHMKETQHLKDMANTIVKKPAAINAIGMFIKPALFLTSFCNLLDEWKWNEIHGESQPVYDEFGSILLLILAFKQRLCLTESELGIQQKAFLAHFFSSKQTEQTKMSETTRKHLGDWIKAFYIDEGLSDELTTKCSAQEFYLLVPTLLGQSVAAHKKGKLSHDTLKAGLEYLLEPFLLPSLLPAFAWMKQVDTNTSQLVMQILSKSPTGEARELHSTILAIAADQLHSDLLPKTRFALEPPSGDLTQIATETYVSLTENARKHGSLETVHALLAILLQGNFHNLLDFVATVIVVSNLRDAVQILHGKVGQHLKKNENLYAEAIVHLTRRVELYATTLIPQDLGIETFVPMNIANMNLDTVPETFSQPEQGGGDIDQVLNEAAAMGIEPSDSLNLDDMYGLQENDFGLGSLDDLDLDMF